MNPCASFNYRSDMFYNFLEETYFAEHYLKFYENFTNSSLTCNCKLFNSSLLTDKVSAKKPWVLPS